jgi:hypothetical protein
MHFVTVLHMVKEGRVHTALFSLQAARREAARRAARERERDLKGNHMMAREEVPPALPLAEPVSIDALSDFLREHTGIWAKQQAFDSVADDRQRVVLGQHQRQRQEMMNL